MIVSRSIREPIRAGMTTEERWHGMDAGLIASWEAGRKLAATDTQLSEAARDGQLPILSWKGGVAGALQTNKKFGTLRYLAMWQGLRGGDLEIDIDAGSELTCSRTGVTVTYTADSSKYNAA